MSQTTAFVSALPVVSVRSTSFSSTLTPITTRPVAPAVSRRSSVVAPRMAAGDKEDTSVPQGFTLYSEQLNGRAAMFGFVVAIATEAITGQGILGQVSSVAETVHAVLPF